MLTALAVTEAQPGYSGYPGPSDGYLPNPLTLHRITKRQEGAEPEAKVSGNEGEDFSFEIRDLYACQCTAKREKKEEAETNPETEASGYEDFSFEIRDFFGNSLV